MDETGVLNNFPRIRIIPFDGMPITADIWAQAHDEHRQARQAHDLFFHGSGIITGLGVMANDPPDQYLFISPGVAVDPAGNVIVLLEPVAYDFGKTIEGELYLLLGHGEREIGGMDKEIRYLQNEFVVAARPSIPKRPSVELARVTLSRRGDAIKNAADPAHPGLEEIDLRYRAVIRPEKKNLQKVAICSLGSELPADMVTGWDYLNRECNRLSQFQLVIDTGLAVTDALKAYSIIYLCGKGSFKVEKTTLKELASLLDQGKSMLVEPWDEPADESFKQMIKGLGIALMPIVENDAILKTPHLFNAPPEGYQGNSVLIGKGIIYTTAKYSMAWSGKVSGGTGSRADIRSALEWGINLINYCASSDS